jgi:hypothetical protein
MVFLLLAWLGAFGLRRHGSSGDAQETALWIGSVAAMIAGTTALSASAIRTGLTAWQKILLVLVLLVALWTFVIAGGAFEPAWTFLASRGIASL